MFILEEVIGRDNLRRFLLCYFTPFNLVVVVVVDVVRMACGIPSYPVSTMKKIAELWG